MATPRFPDATLSPDAITLPDDGDDKDAMSVDVALAALEDMIGQRGLRRFNSAALLKANTEVIANGVMVEEAGTEGIYEYVATGTAFADDGFWLLDATGLGVGQYVRAGMTAANLGRVAAMGTVPGGILAAPSKGIPYPSEAVARSHHVITAAGTGANQRWNLQTNGIWQQNDVTSAGHLICVIDVPHHSVLTSITIVLKNAANVALVSITLPTAILYEINPGSGTATAITNLVTDPSASSAAYKALHTITLDKQPDGVTALAKTIDKANKAYRLDISGEANTDALPGLTVFGVISLTTVTEQDKG